MARERLGGCWSCALPGLALGLLLAACGAPLPTPDPASWDARVAEGQVARAQALAASGDSAGARVEALAGLDAARRAAHPRASADALLLLGRLDRDPARLNDALLYFQGLHDERGATEARVELAEQAVRDGQATAALDWLEGLAPDLSAVPTDVSPTARVVTARQAARVHHVAAAALRLAGRDEAAEARERQANLALSLLPDLDLLELRIANAQLLGDDSARAAQFQRAFELHAHAAALARRGRDTAAELSALSALSTDLQGLGRLNDAADRCTLALSLAQEIDDRVRARELAQRGLVLLAAIGEGRESARWKTFDAAAR